METQKIRQLIEGFFKSLKCEILWENEILKISNVPEFFEKNYGKKSPYFFTFDQEISKRNENIELVTQGSSLIKVITDNLNKKVQNIMLKIVFDNRLQSELKNYIDFKDSSILDLKNEVKSDHIYKFTFLTTFRYLDEKEQLINTIFIRDKNLIDFNLDDFKTEPLKKLDIEQDFIKNSFNIAKESLKSKLDGKIAEISKRLDQSLEIEKNRVISHYVVQIHELNKELEKNNEKIKELEERLRRNPNEFEEINEKINRIRSAIEKQGLEEERQKLEQEKEFFINDQKTKHSLNINNELLNTTIIAFPINHLKLLIKNKENTLKQLEIIYNPVKKEISNIFCDSCRKEIKEINICSTGHLHCNECKKICSCGKPICNLCKSVCVCGKQICNKCSQKCSRCLNNFCSTDLFVDNINRRKICSKCSNLCSICHNRSEKSNFVQCFKCKKSLCQKCTKKDFQTRNNVCPKCYKTPDFLVKF